MDHSRVRPVILFNGYPVHLLDPSLLPVYVAVPKDDVKLARKPRNFDCKDLVLYEAIVGSIN